MIPLLACGLTALAVALVGAQRRVALGVLLAHEKGSRPNTSRRQTIPTTLGGGRLLAAGYLAMHLSIDVVGACIAYAVMPREGPIVAVATGLGGAGSWEFVRSRVAPWVRISLKWEEEKSHFLRKFEEWTVDLVVREADEWAQEMKALSVDPAHVYQELSRRVSSLTLMPSEVRDHLMGRLRAAARGKRGVIKKHSELYRIAVQSGVGGWRSALRALPQRRRNGDWPPPE